MGTALITVAVPEVTKDRVSEWNRPRADFLAQLIATRTLLPQTRSRRRAEPQQAIAAYDAGERLPATSAGHTVSRSL
jgi:hypothetical protein